MQTLILTGESVWKNQRSRLKQLLPAPCTNFIFEAYERIEVKGSKLYSLDLDHQRMTGERFELSPSHLVYVNQNDALRDTAKYVEIEAALTRGHPYCQNTLYQSQELTAFLDHASRGSSDNIGSAPISTAYVHVASMQQRHIRTISLKDTDKGLSLQYLKNACEKTVALYYDAIASEVSKEPSSPMDRSVLLKLAFISDKSVDCKIQPIQLTTVGLTELGLLENSDVILEEILKDLTDIKQKKNAALGSNNKHYIRACKEMGVYCEPITRNKYLIKKEQKRAVYIPYHRTLQPMEAIELSSSKSHTNELLRRQGFKVNAGVTTGIHKRLDELIDVVFSNLRPPFVIKPTDQSAGYGVYLNIGSKINLNRAIDELRSLDKVTDVIIEEQFVGDLYRILVVGDQVVAALRSNLPQLCGTGQDSVATLIKTYNTTHHRKIRNNASLKHFLSTIDLDMNYVIPAGQLVTISLKKNGDVTEDVTDQLAQKYKDIAVAVTEASGLTVNGVDMMIADDGDYRILELNPVPALYQHYAPNYGQSRDIFKYIIEYLLDNYTNEHLDCSNILDHHA